MQKGYTHVCVVLDASGSMNSIKGDVIGSLEDFGAEQGRYEAKGEKFSLDVYTFSNAVYHVAHDAGLGYIPRLTAGYRCQGGTALYDGVCVAIDELGAYFAQLPEERRPESVVVAIVTDGQENASKRFTAADVRERIRVQRDVYSWTFLFLASGIDVEKAAAEIGVKAQDAGSFDRNASRVELCACMSLTMDKVRAKRG